MHYRTVGNRCAVHFQDLHLPVSDQDALRILERIGIRSVEVDLIAIARSIVGKATYKRGAHTEDAPHTFDCSSFIKWLYCQKGIWLPRRSIQQREFGDHVVSKNMQAGDLVFTSGRINYYHNDPDDGVGHVGIATNNNTVIHAASTRRGIIESPYSAFVRKGLRGIKRIIPLHKKVYTLEFSKRDIEWSDDVRWIILQHLGQ